jgi:predicted TIM-barrel fold metal-dependent hydrolase
MLYVKGDSEKKSIRVIDADVHVHESPSQLARYCDEPWRRALLEMRDVGYVDVPGLSHVAQLDPPFPGTIPARTAGTAEELQEFAETFGIDQAILYPEHLLFIGMLPDRHYAAALAHAYNAWLRECILSQSPVLRGTVLAVPQLPGEAAREIRRAGSDPRIVAVLMPTMGIDPLYGDPLYDEVYEAACEMNLPVVFHSAQAIHPVFPFNLHGFNTSLARHAIAHPFSMMANMISLLSGGVPARFPTLKFGFVEGGFTWVPFVLWRLDREYLSYRRQTPWLTRPPSTYINQFYFSSQPLDGTESADGLLSVIRAFGGMNRIMFSTDWPHHDFDHPRKLLEMPLALSEKRLVFAENALSFFRMGESNDD